MAPTKGWPYSPGVSSSVGSSGKSSSAGVSRAVLRQLFLRRRFLRWFLRPFFLRWRFPFLRLAFFRWRFRLLRGVVRSVPPFGAGIPAGGCWRCGRRCPIPAAAPKPSLWWQKPHRSGRGGGTAAHFPSPPHGARDSCRCSPRPSGTGRKSRILIPPWAGFHSPGRRARGRNWETGAPPQIEIEISSLERLLIFPPPGRSPSPPGRRR